MALSLRILLWRVLSVLLWPVRTVLGWLRSLPFWPLPVRFWIVGVTPHAGMLMRCNARMRGTIRRRGERWLVRHEFKQRIRIERFIFPSAIAWRLVIHSVRVDGVEQLAEGTGPFSAVVFSEVAFGVAIAFPPASLVELELERVE